MKINMNARVRVKLTKKGNEILDAAEFASYNERENNYLEFTLWQLMQTFGGNFHIGMTELPFVDNAVELIRE